MGFQPFLIGDYRVGLQLNMEPWKIAREAFVKAENVVMKDGVLSRRAGFKEFARFTNRIASCASISAASEGVVTTDGLHGLAVGDEVTFRDVAGTNNSVVNGVRGTVVAVGSTTQFTIDIDTSTLTHTAGSGHVYKYSESPIMMIGLWRNTNDVEQMLVADQEFCGIWDSSNDRFTQLEVALSGTISAIANGPNAEITLTAHGLSNGDIVRIDGIAADATTASTFNDNIYKVTNVAANTFELDGVTGAGTWGSGGTVYLQNLFTGGDDDFFSWVNFNGNFYFINGVNRLHKYDGSTLSRPICDFQNSTATTNELTSGAKLHVYKNRLGVFAPNESGTVQRRRWRFSSQGDGDKWHDQNNGGTGGYIDAPTGDVYVSSAFLDDNIVAFFRKSVWLLRYTGNTGLPFRFESVGRTRKSEARFATVEHDKFVSNFGSTGIIATDGFSVERIDGAIPNFMYEIDQALIGRCYSYKFEEFEHTWTSYVPFNGSETTHVLVHHFVDGGYTTLDLGKSYDIVGISKADPAVVTTRTVHKLKQGDIVEIASVGGMTEVDGQFRVGSTITDTTFSLEGVDSSGYTTYTSGGTVQASHMSVFGEYPNDDDDIIWSSVNETWLELNRSWVEFLYQSGAALPLAGDSSGFIWRLNQGMADRAREINSDITGEDYKSTIRTKRFNPFVEQGKNAELGFVDFLFSRNSNSDVDVQYFLDSDDGKPVEIDGEDTITMDMTSDRGTPDYVFKRLNLGAVGGWHELELSIDGQDKYMDLHAIILWMRPAGDLEIHA